ncbi:unnamed protein product, partial [Sphacelaria rigidula]
KDDGETDVDCGGASCGPCPSGSSCLVDSDCLYNNCPNPSDSATATVDEGPTCTTPPKACPNDCGSKDAQGTCYHESTVHGGALLPSECLADAPSVVCRARCKCSGSYKGDGCQYSDEEMAAVQDVRRSALEYLESATTGLDVTADILTRQITVLSSLTAVPEEMTTASNALSVRLATKTARLAKDSGQDVTGKAASAFVDVVGQVMLASTYMETESNISALSDLIGDVISAQAAAMIVGQNAKAIVGEYFRLSVGVYDVASVGEFEVSPPLTDAEVAMGRVAPSLSMPGEIGIFSGVSSFSLAVAECILDPRQASDATTAGNTTGGLEMVSTVIRLFADPVETSQSRRLQAGEREGSAVSRESNQRSLFDDLGSIVITIPNSVAMVWKIGETTITHTCEQGSLAQYSSVCPDGTKVATQCTGEAKVNTSECCSAVDASPGVVHWRGQDESSASGSTAGCQVLSYDSESTTYTCDYAATVGSGTGATQVDFASTVLEAGNYATFVSKRSGAADPILSEMEDASPIFVMMGGVLATAVVCMGLGWRKDRRDRGLPRGCCAWVRSVTPIICRCYRRSRHARERVGGRTLSEADNSSSRKPLGMSRDINLTEIMAATGNNIKDVDYYNPHQRHLLHHLHENREKSRMKILLMVLKVHHDFLSVFYTQNRWLTRPQRIALLLCTVVTLMVVDAAVFAAIMLKVSST